MATENNKTDLEVFALEFAKLPDEILKGIANSNEDADFQKNVQLFMEPFKGQFTSLSEYLIQTANKGSAQNINSANKLVQMASGNQMISTAKSVSKNLKSIFSKLALSDIVREIKKLIFFLLDLFNAPEWVYTIILIIDQFLNALLGWDLPDEMDEILSRREVNFYNEIKAHKTTLLSFMKED